MNAKPLWPHQESGLRELFAALESGEQRICLTSPTGGGKSRMLEETIRWATERDWRTSLYTNRTMLLDQIADTLRNAGINFGIRASGHDQAFSLPVQLSMIQTEEERVYKQAVWHLHNADLVLIDECHNQGGDIAQKIIKDHACRVVGVTATPLEIGHIYTKLIVAGHNSDLRKCGAHVPCYTFGPDEPDTWSLKRQATGEFKEGDIVKVIMTPTIFGRVLEHYERYNPEHKPTILFAPGVKESIWFAERFEEAGIRAAHIDGKKIYLDGELFPNSQELRDRIRRESEDGSIKVICNRFVMREGIDFPWLAHCIFATVFGAPTSFLQAGGRLLRSYPGLDRVTLQDHGGNWWRHGSLNADRDWDLSQTNRSVAEAREQRIREKREPEPILCVKCGAVRMHGPRCATCGHESTKKSRPVIQKDGTLKMMHGDILKPRKVKTEPDTQKKWESIFWRARKSKNGMTFAQAEGLFYREFNYWPPPNLGLMPRDGGDKSRRVASVPFSDLIPKPDRQPNPAAHDPQRTFQMEGT